MGAGISSFLSSTFHIFAPLFYHCSATTPWKHIATGNQLDEVYTLASTLLSSLMDLPTTFDSSRYRQLLQEQIPALMAQDSLRTLKLLCKLLARAVELSAHT